MKQFKAVAKSAVNRYQNQTGLRCKYVDYDAIYNRDKGICQICGNHIELNDVEFDHILSINDGGLHIKQNIRITHIICNRKRYRIFNSLRSIIYCLFKQNYSVEKIEEETGINRSYINNIRKQYEKETGVKIQVKRKKPKSYKENIFS